MSAFLQDLRLGIEELRLRSRVSQGELAGRMGVSQSTVSKMARGRSLTGENLGLWLGALGADLHDLAQAVTAVSARAPRPATPSTRLHGLHREIRLLVAEVQRLEAERPSGSVREVRRALQAAEDGVRCLVRDESAGGDGDAVDPERWLGRRLSDPEFGEVLDLLREMVHRAVAVELGERREGGRPPGDGASGTH